MAELFDETDATILATMRGLHERRDPVPPDLAERVKLAMTVEALHADLAELTATPLVASRADVAQASDSITFSTPQLSLMVAVSDVTPASMTIDGWLSSPGLDIEVHAAGTVVEVTADEHGRFAVTEVGRGPTWFVVLPAESSDDAPVVTPTVDL